DPPDRAVRARGVRIAGSAVFSNPEDKVNRFLGFFRKMFSRALANRCTLAIKESVSRPCLRHSPREVSPVISVSQSPDLEVCYGRPGFPDFPATGDLQLHPQQDPRTGLRTDGPRDRRPLPDQEPQWGDVPPQGPSEEGADPSRAEHVEGHPVAGGSGQSASD